MTTPTLAITAWPAVPLPLPSYRRRRYRLQREGHSETLVGEPLDDVVTPSGLTCLRLAEVALDDTNQILAFVNAVGTAGFGGGPEEESVAEFVLGATVVRDAVSAWRLLTGESDQVGVHWDLPRLVNVADEQVQDAAAEYLNDVLASGLPSVSPIIAVSVDDADDAPVVEVNLHTLCCLELFNHVAGGAAFARCANETCARLFVLDERARRRGVRYCSRPCARAQAQREFRRRRASGEVKSA